MATPPKHERALGLGGRRDGLRTAGLADSGLSRNQDYLTPAREHAAECGATKVQLARATNDEAMRTLNRIAHVDLIRLARLHLAVYRIPQRGFTPLARYRSTALDGSAYAFALLGALFRCHNRLVGLRHRILGCSVDAGRISVLREGIELAELLTGLGGTVLDALLQLNRP